MSFPYCEVAPLGNIDTMTESKYSNLFAIVNQPSHSVHLLALKFLMLFEAGEPHRTSHMVRHMVDFSNMQAICGLIPGQSVIWSIHWVFGILEVAVFVMSIFLIKLRSTKAHCRQMFYKFIQQCAYDMVACQYTIPISRTELQNSATRRSGVPSGCGAGPGVTLLCQQQNLGPLFTRGTGSRWFRFFRDLAGDVVVKSMSPVSVVTFTWQVTYYIQCHGIILDRGRSLA